MTEIQLLNVLCAGAMVPVALYAIILYIAIKRAYSTRTAYSYMLVMTLNLFIISAYHFLDEVLTFADELGPLRLMPYYILGFITLGCFIGLSIQLGNESSLKK